MPKEPLIYLIGPLTPVGRHRLNPVFEYLYNLRAFFEAEAVLTGQGIAVINPAADFLAVMIKPGSLTEQQVRAASIIKLQHCDAVMVLPGWERSEGAKAEKERADKLRIPVFYNIGTLLEALQVDDIMGHISDYLKSREKINSSAQKIGEAICGAVKDIIPDIEYRVGDMEDPTKIWFMSNETRWQFEDTKENLSGWEPFWSPVSKVFPEIEDYIADDMMYISPEMQEKVIRRLETLRPAGK